MRYFCWTCKKSVTSELPDDSIIRAVLVCPECIEAKRVVIKEDDDIADREAQRFFGQ
jgi:DNA-directed RNA polymerase subunit RPC12/RpoP